LPTTCFFSARDADQIDLVIEHATVHLLAFIEIVEGLIAACEANSL
jgi:hypothetical protein